MTAWWSVAVSEAVTDGPLAVRCDDEDVVVFRDRTGVVRAFEDRCAHRRAPLSLGHLTDDGALQCGYHGWCFDVNSGHCVGIPNLRPDERVPSRFIVRRFGAAEWNGLVFVSTGDPEMAEPMFPATGEFTSGAGRAWGSSRLPVRHDVFVEALLDRPRMVLRLPELVLDDVVPQVSVDGERGLVVADRFGQRKLPHANFVSSTSMLRLRTETQPVTGLTRLMLQRPGGRTELVVIIGSAPLGPYVTALTWRVTEAAGWGRATAAAWRLGAGFHLGPFRLDVSEARAAGMPDQMHEASRRWQEVTSAAMSVGRA